MAIVESLGEEVELVRKDGAVLAGPEGNKDDDEVRIVTIRSGSEDAHQDAGHTCCNLDTSGRRPLLLISSTGMATALATVAVMFRLLHVSAHGDTLATEHASPAVVAIAMVAICGFMASFSIGFGPTVYVLTSEIFPLTLRACAMALSVAVNRGVSGTVALTYLSLATALTTSGAFFVYTSIAVASVVFIYFVVPETKGKSLEEVCKYFGWDPLQEEKLQELKHIHGDTNA